MGKKWVPQPLPYQEVGPADPKGKLSLDAQRAPADAEGDLGFSQGPVWVGPE